MDKDKIIMIINILLVLAVIVISIVGFFLIFSNWGDIREAVQSPSQTENLSN